MDQVSAPIRIAFVAILAIAALWFVALRPKPADEVPSVPTPPLAGAVDAAQDASATSDAANARLQEATGEPSAAPGAQAADAAAAPAAAGSDSGSSASGKTASSQRDLAAPLLRDLRNGRAVVVLFAAKGADDRAAKAAVRGVDRRDGRVRVAVASIGDVSRYEEITTGVQVSQAPTTLVIGPDRQATAITGYTDVAEVEQAVGDALRRKK